MDIFKLRTLFYFEQMVHRIFTAELKLNKANAFDTEAAFLDLNLSIQDDFDFDIVNFPFLDGDVPRRPSYGYFVRLLSGHLLGNSCSLG